MTERPILMSAPMVCACLDGTKSQTRRVLKQATGPSLSVDMSDDAPGVAELSWLWGDGPGYDVNETIKRVACPYGRPGDRLWVREAWMPDPPCDGTWGYTAWAGSRIGQIAAVPERFQHPAFCNYRASWLHGTDGLRWTPGIHMPRWASRITLEITGVRVERLQDISKADSRAEGVSYDPGEGGTFHVPGLVGCASDSALDSYRKLWEQINGPESWDANPWVWCVEFNHIEAKDGV